MNKMSEIRTTRQKLNKHNFYTRLYVRYNNCCCWWLLHPIRCTRRTTVPPPWMMAVHEKRVEQHLSPDTEQFLRAEASTAKVLKSESPLADEPWVYPEWTENSHRTGLLVKKIGVYPQWLQTGRRVLCTLLQVLDNHVISYTDPETWYKESKVGKKKSFGRYGVRGRLVVGAVEGDPQKYTAAYRSQFDRIGLPPKRHLAAFGVTPDAKVQPGTRLYANHFLIGQHVTLTGKSIDWGFQGVIHRWGMHGGVSDARGGTKSHRRVGAIGSTGDSRVWPGKRLPGHMGWEWVRRPGIKILRIDVENQVIYVLGPGIPGDNGEILHMRDTMYKDVDRRVKNPPFPTYFPDETSEPLRNELFDESLFQMTEPSITFEAGEAEDYADMLKRAQVKKQAKARRK